jgi:hypothetical protein
MENSEIMAAPTFVSVGSPASGTGAISVPWGAGHQTDDIGVLIVQTANQAVATPAGWTALGNIGTGTAGASGATALWAFWKRATSAAEADASVADPGDHARGKIMVFRGCETSGSPFTGSVLTGVKASPDTAVSIPMPTTGTTDCFAVGVVTNATLTTSNQTTVGSWQNTDLPDFTRIVNGNTNLGVGGGIDGGGGTKAVAGAISNSASTLTTASAQAYLSFALKPPAGAGATTPTEGGIYVATGLKGSIGVVNATVATLDAAAVQARITIALKPEVAVPTNSPPILEGVPAIVGAVGNPVQFPITATDPNPGETVTLSLVAGATAVPVGASLIQDEQSGNFSFTWTPTTDQVGEWSFILRATDSNVAPLSADTVISIVVQGGPTRGPFGSASGGLNSLV